MVAAAGRFTDVRALQYRKASPPMVVTAGKLTDVRA
jgi:hypothetical protein